MELEFSERKIKNFFGKKSEVKKTDSSWIIEKKVNDNLYQIYIEKNKLNKLLSKLKICDFKKRVLYNPKNYKKTDFRFEIPIKKSDFWVNHDLRVGTLEFEINHLSDLYLLHLLLHIPQPTIRHYQGSIIKKIMDFTETNIDLWDFLRKVSENILNCHSLNIKSLLPLSYSEFSRLADSYIFYYSYATNIAIQRKDPYNAHFRPIYLGPGFDNSEIPIEKIRTELLTYYLQGTKSNDPFVSYISYYHIIEYFFKIVKAELKESLIFSDQENFEGSDKELKRIILENSSNEKMELELVLRKYITKTKLKNDLNLFESSYYDKIRNNKVHFADADKLVESNFYPSLKNRIYKTRNALVHRKEGHRDGKYLPFDISHKLELEDEILLIRVIASEIVRQDAKHRFKTN